MQLKRKSASTNSSLLQLSDSTDSELLQLSASTIDDCRLRVNSVLEVGLTLQEFNSKL